jgi:hypothetical protein
MSAIDDKIKAIVYSLPHLQVSNPNRTGCVVVVSVIFVSGHGLNLGNAGMKVQIKGRARPRPRRGLRNCAL